MRNLTYILFLFCSSLIAQTVVFPTPVNLDDVNDEVYQAPNSLPGYLQPFTNNYGLTVTRISDDVIFGVNSQQLSHNYASDQPWNSDGSLIKLAGYPSAILDGDTYEFLYWANIPGIARWYENNPNFMYGEAQNRLERLDVRDNTRTILHTFSDFNTISIGYGEGNADKNDQYIALIGDNTTLIIYDMQNDIIVATKDIDASADLDNFLVSPLGNYVILHWREDGNGPTQGFKRLNLDLTNEVHLWNYTQHSDVGVLENGQEVLFQYGDELDWAAQHYLNMVNLTTGEVTPKFYWPFDLHNGNSGIWGGHISMRSNRAGVAYVSESCCNGHSTLPSELFAIHLDDSNTIERFAKHHSNRDLNNNGNLNDDAWSYNHSPRLVPNRDGTKILFTSNYHDFETQQLHAGFTFIVEMPQDVLQVQEFENKIKMFPNPTSGIINVNVDNFTAKIFDVTGKKLNFKSDKKIIDITNFEAGCYSVLINVNNRVEMFKIIKL